MARPNAIGLRVASPCGMKKPKTDTMMIAAATTTFAVCTKPASTGSTVLPCTCSSRMRVVRKTS